MHLLSGECSICSWKECIFCWSWVQFSIYVVGLKLVGNLTRVSHSLIPPLWLWGSLWACWGISCGRSWRRPLAISSKTAGNWFCQQPEWAWKQIFLHLSLTWHCSSDGYLYCQLRHAQVPDPEKLKWYMCRWLI